MPQTQPSEITMLLQRSRTGDDEALRELLPIVYETLRQAARRELQHERGNHTLQPTALLHEAWLRLFNIDSQSVYQWKDRAHFMAIATRQMRLILIDHARAKHAAKRDGQQQVDLAEDILVEIPISAELLALDEALTRLAVELPRAAQVVELRYFGGLTEEEVAESLAISVATVKRDWKFARQWLFNQLKPR